MNITAINKTTEPLNIFQAIRQIMSDMGAITKDRKNPQQGYSFRGIDDFYNTLHPLFALYGVFSTSEVLSVDRQEKTTKNGTVMICTTIKMTFTFYAMDGSKVQTTTVGESADSGDKSCNKAMASAHKYALMQMFAVPTEEDKDTEAESPEFTPQNPQNSHERISEPQAKRLFAIANEMGWKNEEIKELISNYGYDSTKEILKSDYEMIIKELQK